MNIESGFFQLSFIQLQPNDTGSQETTALAVASVRMNISQIERYIEDLQKNLVSYKSLANKKSE
jgi:hypothetical protein